MRLPKTEEFIKKGIKMYKVIDEAGYGLFYHKSETRDYKTVYDLEEAIELNANHNWHFVNYDQFFSNLALFTFRDLRDMKIKSKGKK